MAFGFERMAWTHKQWLFLLVVLMASLFIFEYTSDLVSIVLNFKLELMPFFSVRNIAGILLFGFAILTYLNQVDYKEIQIFGFQITRILFIASLVVAGAYLFEPAQELVSFINYKLDFFPIISVRNILGLFLLLMVRKIYKTVRP